MIVTAIDKVKNFIRSRERSGSGDVSKVLINFRSFECARQVRGYIVRLVVDVVSTIFHLFHNGVGLLDKIYLQPNEESNLIVIPSDGYNGDKVDERLEAAKKKKKKKKMKEGVS